MDRRLIYAFGLLTLAILLFLSSSPRAEPQLSSQVALACPPGTALMPNGQTYNNVTGQYKQWACVDTQGNVYLTIAHALTGGATAPTCSVTGAGTGGSCSLSSGSSPSDFAGIMQITTGTTPGTSGTVTLTFATPFQATSACTFTLGNGGVAWNARATIIQSAYGTSTAVENWDNNAVALTGSQVNGYLVNYLCSGK